jgi:hypothetical protein
VCGHAFHTFCLEKWAEENGGGKLCPLCTLNLPRKRRNDSQFEDKDVDIDDDDNQPYEMQNTTAPPFVFVILLLVLIIWLFVPPIPSATKDLQ